MMRRVVSLSAALGAAIATVLAMLGVVLNTFFQGGPFHWHDWLDWVYIILWPFSLGTIGADNASAFEQTLLALLLISLNAVLYAALGFGAWCAAKLIAIVSAGFGKHRRARL
jgi:hypothetical protein